MKVLMFGWEYPPHVFGGLATANYGITHGLKALGDMETLLCLPRPFGDEEQDACKIIGMNSVPIAWRDVSYDYVKQRLGNIMSPDDYYRYREHIYADFNYMHVNDLGCMEFAGGYPSNLTEEINNYSIIAGVVARTEQFDIIHAHDWLTYPAGIHAKQVSGKPLVIHVHATDFDRSRGNVNPTVYGIERNGMDNADCIMCVSELTRQTVINHYGQDPAKCFAMHNAVYPLAPELQEIVDQRLPYKDRKEKVVTFLGRIPMQKGPEYFIEAAKRVLERTNNVRFCFAGSGDMMNDMINMAAAYGIADRCHFPGFMKGKQVFEIFRDSDVYVMPSVSEPFGISPLEAMQSGVPSIISKQSGCAEILNNVIKVDYWDTNAIADAIYSIIKYPAMYKQLQEQGLEEVNQITWDRAGAKVINIYNNLINR